MGVNFNELLTKPVGSAKPPPTKPPGTYTGTIQGYTFASSKQKGTPYCRITFNNIQPGEALLSGDPKYLQDSDGEPIDFAKWTPHIDFFLTADAEYRLHDFLKGVLGEEITAGRPVNEVLPEIKGQAVIIEMTQSNSDDGKKIFTNPTTVTGA